MEDDALSFCDLPIAGKGTCETHVSQLTNQEQHDRFEFFKDLGAEMSAAEDIFYRGQIRPLKLSSSSSSSSTSSNRDFVRRRVGSMDESGSVSYRSSSDSSRASSRSSSTGKTRNRYGFESPKLQKSSRSDSRVKKMGGDYDFPARRPSQAKPKWHEFVFGLMKLPEMEMKDIRNRQRRRNPELDGSRQTVSDRGESRSSWRLFRGLSCKGDANVLVASSLGCVPHV